MKTLLLLIFVLAIGRTAMAQTDLLQGSRSNVWDTINNSFIGTDSSAYEYDAQGHVTTRLNIRRNSSTNQWDTTGKTAYNYNTTLGLVAAATYYSFNSTTSIFTPTGRTQYQYDTDSLPSYTTDYTYISGTFVAIGRYENYYNTLRQITNAYYKPWSTTTNTFTNQKKTVYHYNALNQNDTITDLIWNGTTWGNSSYAALQYNVQGLVSGRTSYSWYSGSWQYGIRQTFSYYPDSLTQEKFLFQDIGSGLFRNVNRETYTYQARTTKQDAYYLWDNANTVWYAYEQTDYTIDGNNRQTARDYMKLDTATHTLTLRQHTTYEYDADGNYHYGISAALVPHLGILRNVSEVYNWYLLSPTVIENILPVTDVLLYPNPTGNELHISYRNESFQPVNLMLYNSNGRLLQNSRIDARGSEITTINTTNLSNGVYVLQFVNNKQQSSYKFLVQH